MLRYLSLSWLFWVGGWLGGDNKSLLLAPLLGLTFVLSLVRRLWICSWKQKTLVRSCLVCSRAFWDQHRNIAEHFSQNSLGGIFPKILHTRSVRVMIDKLLSTTLSSLSCEKKMVWEFRAWHCLAIPHMSVVWPSFVFFGRSEVPCECWRNNHGDLEKGHLKLCAIRFRAKKCAFVLLVGLLGVVVVFLVGLRWLLWLWWVGMVLVLVLMSQSALRRNKFLLAGDKKNHANGKKNGHLKISAAQGEKLDKYFPGIHFFF